jgi:hypothetical protein
MKKGQSSIEFLIITGFGLLLITGISFVFLNYSQTTQDQTRTQQASQIGSTFINNAGEMYALGANSWVTITVTMPDKIVDVYTTENNSIVFELGTATGVQTQPVFSSVPIRGVTVSGDRVSVYNTTVFPHSGPTDFRITSQGNVVTIQAIS